MAIKFSQFVVKTSSSDLSHIVGYNGVDNIQITPTNFLNSALTGTPGQVLFFDTTGVTGSNSLFFDTSNNRLGIGTNSPQKTLDVANGDIRLDNSKGIMFATLDGNIGRVKIIGDENGDFIQMNVDNSNNHLLRLDTTGVGIGTTSPSEKLEVIGNIKVGDSQQFIAGDSQDLQIYHDGTDSRIYNNAGDFVIRNQQDDGDIKFQSDDGSGGVAEYFRLDGADVKLYASVDLKFNDSVSASFGNNDLLIQHNGTKSFINNYTGNLEISNLADDSDIKFICDDGSGGVATYYYLDGSIGINRFLKSVRWDDNIQANFGSGGDSRIYHDATNTYIDNFTGHLKIRNYSDDQDIIFESDDGSGGLATYFFLDGSRADGTYLYTEFPDNSVIGLGNDTDLQIYHSGTNSLIDNFVGDLIIQQKADDQNIIFKSDDGSGGTTEYFRVDGGNEHVVYSKPTIFSDNIALKFGDGIDLQIKSDGSNGKITNNIGNLEITQNADDKNIEFYSDDASGGVTRYFFIDGQNKRIKAQEIFTIMDGSSLRLGGSETGQLLHSGGNTLLKQVNSGDIIIRQTVDDGDIKFESDNGSGGTTEYFRLDGSNERLQVDAPNGMLFSDNIKAKFGTGADLQIYHDGSNSYIDEVGTGSLYIRSAGAIRLQSDTGENMIYAVNDGAVNLYHNNVKKFETTGNGINIQGVSAYADNAAAIAGGLTTGDVYRTGDLLKIVH